MFRNLLHVIRNFKAAFILNLLGLAVAFTAFMMIMMQVRHDLTFDRCYDGAERIFRLDIEIDGRGQAIVNRPLARLFCQSSPEITAGCIMDAGPASNFWYTGEGGTRKGSKETFWDVSPGTLDVFGFMMAEGGNDALDAPLSAVIPESMAKRLFGEGFSWEDGNLKLTLHSLPELHFKSAGQFDGLPKASRGTVNALIAIAFIILLIAGINFTNFSTALAPMRIRGINTRKVLGSSNLTIRCGIVGEIILISAIAYLLSVLMLRLAGMTPLSSLLDCDMSLGRNVGIILACAAAAVILGTLSALYPAFYMTSLPPALVLKGSFGLSASGRRLRTVLVGVQFTAAFALVIAASFIWLQNRHMLKTPLGYDKDQLIVTDINENISKSGDAFKEDIRRTAGVENVSFSAFTLAAGDFYMTWGREFRGEQISFACLPVDHDFLNTMGISVTEGRNFSAEDEMKENGTYIFNETARRQYDMHAGEDIYGDEIAGFIPDINFASMRQSITPMAFYMFGKEHWGSPFQTAYVRVSAGSDLRAVRKAVEDCLRNFDPEYPFQVRFYDSILESTYQKEQRTGSLIALFSLVAIFISIVGVFSLVVFDCEYRRKETAVRKVLGSTGGEITGMFCRSYLTVLAVCFVIGAPVAWLAVDKWLESFAYRTPLHWWVFPAAFAAIAAVTLLTVAWQSWRVANENPVKNLRTE